MKTNGPTRVRPNSEKGTANPTAEQREKMSLSHKGQTPWNYGKRGCQRGHDPEMYICPPSGVWICLACKRENGAKYRSKNQQEITRKGRLGRYGISETEFHALWTKQAGACAICKRQFADVEYRIDHDHKTGAVRGLLCVACNTGIGLLQDSPTVIAAAAAYIETFSAGLHDTPESAA
jgi:hypothetical protein